MDSVVSYMKSRKLARSWSTFASQLLVESALRVLPWLVCDNIPTSTTYKAFASILASRDYLEELAGTNLRVSARGSVLLSSLLNQMRGLPTSTIPMSICAATPILTLDDYGSNEQRVHELVDDTKP